MILLAALLCNYGRGKCLIDIGTEGDPERLARFEREAKVLASLNHPNIALCLSKTPCRVKWPRTRACEGANSPSVLLATKGYMVQHGHQWRLVVSKARKRP
jgi:hypothetical protein